MGLFLIRGHFCHKVQKGSAKCVFRTVYVCGGTLFPPVAEIYARLAGNFCQ
jgi:hypothetical protein